MACERAAGTGGALLKQLPLVLRVVYTRRMRCLWYEAALVGM